MGHVGAKELERQPPDSAFDWARVAYTVLASRALDNLEEQRLVPERRVAYQFSARGHELAQVILGTLLTHPRDAVSVYYRSRPLVLTLGVSLVDAVAGSLGRSGGCSDGRDVGVVWNLPRREGACILPMAGDVGSQFTPAAGWAQAIHYRRRTLGEDNWEGAIAVAHGGDGAVATNGFWSALTMATTLQLPLVFYIEDNGFSISVPSTQQVPGGNIAKNLAAFSTLRVFDGDGTAPADVLAILGAAIDATRSGGGPCLVRLAVPRLSGHSAQDNQAYKSARLVEEEWRNDPIEKLQSWLVPRLMAPEEWKKLETRARRAVEAAFEAALRRPEPDSSTVRKWVFFERRIGGLDNGSATRGPEPRALGPRINMVSAIRRTLESELTVNPRLLVFGQDVGRKGGVHAATLGLQKTFGEARVFDTGLSEEGIIGRAVGLALAGLRPAAEIQFRKYADAGTEQLTNCGTIRWRTANRFMAPIVVRMPCGHARVGDPWHSVSNEAVWAHAIGWRVAYPSNAEDAVGLLRTALRSDDPTILLEHRAMLDAAWARRPYPGDDYVLPFGRGRVIEAGTQVTVVTWGGMVERCVAAAELSGVSAEVIDLRTIIPWDRDLVLTSLQKTRRCLIVHEDTVTGGFGAEIAAVVAKEAFYVLDAPIERIAVPDVPVPYNIRLMEAIMPSAPDIAVKMASLTKA
jgi:2-oxoisovalerate dehydrogenase E1 component